MLRMVTVWRAVSQLVIAIESEKAASSRCGERMRIFRCGSHAAAKLFYWDVIAGLGPVGDEAVDNDVTDAVSVIQRGKVGAVLADLGLGEAFCGVGSDALLVVVRRGAEDEDAVDVELVRF